MALSDHEAGVRATIRSARPGTSRCGPGDATPTAVLAVSGATDAVSVAGDRALLSDGTIVPWDHSYGVAQYVSTLTGL